MLDLHKEVASGGDIWANAKGQGPAVFARVGQSASVSYKTLLNPAALAAAMVDGALPKGITPHVATLLDEAPLSLIVATVEEVASASSISPKLLWKHVFHWAKDLQSPRSVWA